MSDEQVKQDVQDQLFWDSRVDASNIEVEVFGGNAVLKGTVPTYGARQAAARRARSVAGVVGVENDLSVVFPPGSAVPSDERIRESIIRTLRWNPDFDTANIKVSVVSSVVTLEGTVDAYWKKRRAEDLVVGVTGVKEIVNALAVVPSEQVVDKAVAAEIVSAIDRHANVDARSVDVKVNDGKVTLSGTVNNWAAYIAAQDTAEHTTGVFEVENNLTIDTKK